MKSELKDWRNEHVDALLERFREVVPTSTKVTVLADPGFGDHKLYELLEDQLGFDYVIRFRGSSRSPTKSHPATTREFGKAGEFERAEPSPPKAR